MCGLNIIKAYNWGSRRTSSSNTLWQSWLQQIFVWCYDINMLHKAGQTPWWHGREKCSYIYIYGMCPYITGFLAWEDWTPFWENIPEWFACKVKPVFRGHCTTPEKVSLNDRCPFLQMCMHHRCLSICYCSEKTCPDHRVSSLDSVPWWQILLYRGCPLIRVSFEDRFYCIEGVPSSECPLKAGFTV